MSNGCEIYSGGEYRRFNECITPVVDMVGDAFGAGVLHSFLTGADAFSNTKTGNILADYVASKHGAIPEYDDKLIRE